MDRRKRRQIGDNNPRALSNAARVSSWRTAFEGVPAEADLHIDVLFGEGLIGGDDDAETPVSFRLYLKSAEIVMHHDRSGSLQILRSTLRDFPPEIELSSTELNDPSTSNPTKFEAQLGPDGISANFTGNIKNLLSVGKRKLPKFAAAAKTESMPTEDGCVFRVTPVGGELLRCKPWNKSTPVLRVRDMNANRQRGTPPELVISIRCRRENLFVDNIVFRGEAGAWRWNEIDREHQVVIEQYLKDEIVKTGLDAGDMSGDFSLVGLADVVTIEE